MKCTLKDHGICTANLCIGRKECLLRKFFLEEQIGNRRMLRSCRPGSAAYKLISDRIYSYRRKPHADIREVNQEVEQSCEVKTGGVEPAPLREKRGEQARPLFC